MATAAQKVNGTTATTADLSDQINTLKDDLGALTKIIADLGKEKGDDAVSAVKARASALKNTAEETADLARAKSADLQDQANDFVKTQPAMALGIAAGVGFLVGILGSRK